MSEDKKKIPAEIAESVDDIIAGILNEDGSFNEEFNGLLAKYTGIPQSAVTVPGVDLSDRTDEYIPRENISHEHIEYDSGEISFSRNKTADNRIEEKIPENVRDVYSEAEARATRPEFTATGGVKYPTMGTGASEERVVFDADWEETARNEARRLERVRQDRMLRGDSAYARTFVAGGMYMPERNPYIDNSRPASPYIDPLSRDSDFERADENSQYYNSHNKPFFPEGFSVVQKNNVAASGKTEYQRSGNRQNSGRRIPEETYDSFVRSDESARKSQAAWLTVEDKTKKKKNSRSFLKKSKNINGKNEKNLWDIPEKEEKDSFVSNNEYVAPKKVNPYEDENIADVSSQTSGLRSTVLEIVEKYNKRSEEDERRKLEALAIKEEKRREEELRQRMREEELRRLKQSMSPELCEVLDTETETIGEDYDDFSTEKVEKKEEKPIKSYGVNFDPTVFSGETYLEKIDETYEVENSEVNGFNFEFPQDDGEFSGEISNKGKTKPKEKTRFRGKNK